MTRFVFARSAFLLLSLRVSFYNASLAVSLPLSSVKLFTSLYFSLLSLSLSKSSIYLSLSLSFSFLSLSVSLFIYYTVIRCTVPSVILCWHGACATGTAFFADEAHG